MTWESSDHIKRPTISIEPQNQFQEDNTRKTSLPITMMKLIASLSLLVMVATLVEGGHRRRPRFCRSPSWPDDFLWSNDGPVDGYECTEISETADPEWDNNYFCQKSGDGIRNIDIQWSSAG